MPYEPWLPLGIVSNALAGLLILPAATIRIKRLPWLFATYSVGSIGCHRWPRAVVRAGPRPGLSGYLYSLIVANAALAGASIVLMLRFSRPSLTSPGLRGALQLALPALPSATISTVGVTLDRILLAQFASLQTLGTYAVAMRFVELIGALHQSLKMTFVPFTMQHIAADLQRGRQLVGAILPFYLIPYLAATLGLVLFIGPVVRIIDRPEYFPVVEWVPWLAGAYLIACFARLFRERHTPRQPNGSAHDPRRCPVGSDDRHGLPADPALPARRRGRDSVRGRDRVIRVESLSVTQGVPDRTPMG